MPGDPAAKQALRSPTPVHARPPSRWTWAALAYVAAVLAIDTMAAHHVRWAGDWGWFHWTLADGARLVGYARNNTAALQNFDLFKFLLWFCVPVLFSLHKMDWGWLGCKKWKRLDLALLALFLLLAAGTMFLIPLFPSLRGTYPSLQSLPSHQKTTLLAHKALWTFSWLLGWEFLHRYFLLRPAHARWPRWGWLLVPLSEVAYHLQKPLPEAAAMGLFSLVATRWTLYRANMALPFLVHAAVELSLWLFILYG